MNKILSQKEKNILALVKRRKQIDSYQFAPSEWKKIAPSLYSLKRKGLVKSRKMIVYGGASGGLNATVWSIS